MAGQWLQALPPSPSREAAVTAYINQVTGPTPELAAPWVETIIDESSRFSQIETIARRWLETDHATAAAWLARVNLPEDRKKLLLGQP